MGRLMGERRLSLRQMEAMETYPQWSEDCVLSQKRPKEEGKYGGREKEEEEEREEKRTTEQKGKVSALGRKT